ncbi:COMM domain-containing protein 1 isoform X5 [Strix aluco]|uniref:COMM domain-containing protein 1 isoform X5 n=1 Tax=Strix aluco TaxID=111821 RepID=UPI003DA38CBD
MAAPEPPPPPPPEGSKPLSALLSGIAQAAYYGNADITEELLRGQLYPEAAPEEFRALRAKMGGLLQSIASADMDLNQLEAFLTAQTKKQGGITSDQAAVIAKFWKNHRIKIHESLINQSRWDNVLKNMNWRVDLKSQSRHIDQINTPVAIVEMELGKNGQLQTLVILLVFRVFLGKVDDLSFTCRGNIDWKWRQRNVVLVFGSVLCLAEQNSVPHGIQQHIRRYSSGKHLWDVFQQGCVILHQKGIRVSLSGV